MKKLVMCIALLLVNRVSYPMLWKEDTTFDKQFNDCIQAVEENHIEFFEDNYDELVKAKMFVMWNSALGTSYDKTRKYYHYNLLSIAVQHKRKEIVKIILEYLKKHKIILSQFYYKISPLYWAVKNALDNAKENILQDDDRAMVQLLLDYGYSPYLITSRDDVQFHSFDKAIQKNNMDLIKMFLEADKKQKFVPFGASPLHEALGEGKDAIATFLIESDDSEDGKLINKKDDGKWRPLHVAVQNDLDFFVECLLQSGVKINKKTMYKEIALHIAAYQRSKVNTEKLIENGANPSIKDRKEKLAEDVTKDEEIKLFLQNARAVQEWCSNFSEKDGAEKLFSLIQSFPLLSFALHQMRSSKDFSTLYNIISKYEKNNNVIMCKELCESDFKDFVVKKAGLRLKAHFYNLSMISNDEYLNKFGKDEFNKMVLTAKRIGQCNKKIKHEE